MECICGGMNPDCYRCGGSGGPLSSKFAAKKARHLLSLAKKPVAVQAQVKTVSSNPAPKTKPIVAKAATTSTSRPAMSTIEMTKCEICGVKVSLKKLSRHMRRTHGAENSRRHISPTSPIGIAAIKIAKSGAEPEGQLVHQKAAPMLGKRKKRPIRSTGLIASANIPSSMRMFRGAGRGNPEYAVSSAFESNKKHH